MNNTPGNKEYKDTLHENGLYITMPDQMRTMIDDRFQSADAKTRLDLFHIMNLLVLQSDQLYTAKFEKPLNSASYMQAEEQLTLGVALLIFDVRTMKMVWSFNGQGMLGMKGESVLFQCH